MTNNFYNLNGKCNFLEKKDLKKEKSKVDYLKNIYFNKIDKYWEDDKKSLEELKKLRKEIDDIEKELFFLIEY